MKAPSLRKISLPQPKDQQKMNQNQRFNKKFKYLNPKKKRDIMEEVARDYQVQRVCQLLQI